VLARYYRPLVVLTLAGGTITFALAAFSNLYLNRLTMTNIFVTFSVALLFFVLLLLIIRYAVLMWFAHLQHVERVADPLEVNEYPLVTVIVPAYNEEKVIQTAVEAALWIDYPRFEVLVVDDGSTDSTYERAIQLTGMYGSRVRVITQPNAGKAAALNSGIANARGEFVLCIDADSRLERQTLKQAMKHFRDPSVGAVAGSVKVVNRDTLLCKLQALEYVEGLGLVRAAQGFLRRINIIPGPVGIFRKRMLEEIGGYERDTYAEDCELTLRILFKGWKINYESQAIAWTEAPESVHALFKQRYRWGRGILQSAIKHRHYLLKLYPNTMDNLMLWFLVFESVVWPGINLFALSFFIFVAVTFGFTNIIFFWWMQLTILDVVAALFCVAVEKEDIRLVGYSVLYRLYYVPLVDAMKFFAALDELFNVEMRWAKLERFGRI
jgi:poly-beta-1,6-N-acetyl-D-glucosamine synthase